MPATAPAPSPPDDGAAPRHRPLPLPSTIAVAGVSFYADAVARVAAGDAVALEREPSNPHDVNAVRIRRVADGARLGHAPREVARRLAVRDEDRWLGEVVEVLEGSRATGLRVRVDAQPPPSLPVCAPPPPHAAPLRDDDVGGDDVPAVADDAPRVRMRTGHRDLGRLAGFDGDRVLVVADGDDAAVGYPARLVTVDDEADAGDADA